MSPSNQKINNSGNSLNKRISFRLLSAISFSHLINDMLQSMILAAYPLIKGFLSLSFTQIGLITLTYQLTASILQPLVGIYTDRHHKPYSLPFGMCITLVGLLLFSFANSFHSLLFAVAIIGIGSSIFHPESSRVARMASGGQFGLAQSIFQVGGNFGSSIGPLIIMLLISSQASNQREVAWLSLAAIIAIFILLRVSAWYKTQQTKSAQTKQQLNTTSPFPAKKVILAVGILLILLFSKYFYMISMSNYFTFYLIEKFHISVHKAPIFLFLFLFAVAAGTVIGGPLSDRIGRKYVIWFSILGVSPFTLMLPYANLFWTATLSVIIGVILASAFSAILVYAQEMLPGKIGMVSGLFFGLAFGIGGIGSAALGWISDHQGIEFVYHLCSFLPLLGILAMFLPPIERKKSA